MIPRNLVFVVLCLLTSTWRAEADILSTARTLFSRAEVELPTQELPVDDEVDEVNLIMIFFLIHSKIII